MIDARITIDELVIECAAELSEAEARRLGGGVAQELAHQLEQLQVLRMRAIGRAAIAPRPIHIERLVARLTSPDVSTFEIGRSLRAAIDDARRSDEQPV